jgi:hypothetical protein
MAEDKNKKKTAKKKQSVQAKDSQQEKEPDKMTAIALVQDERKLKVKLPIKLMVIVLSVVALSWFFEGFRQVQNSITIAHIAFFAGGILSTALLLGIQAFWIYLEEKYKGTLRQKIDHFEKLEEYWLRKRNK